MSESPRPRRESVADAAERGHADSFSHIAPVAAMEVDGLSRRLTYLMALRVLLITLVLGATTLLYWLGDVDLTQPNSLVLYTVVGATYVLTLFYARWLKRNDDLRRLAVIQLSGDLIIATIIVHVTGGAQSAYTFFYPLAVIGSAVVRYQRGAIVVAFSAALLFTVVSTLGWLDILPTPAGQKLLPTEMSPLSFGRALALNLAAIAGVGAMAIQLAKQLQESSADVAAHRSVAADLLTLHEDIVRCLTSGLITVDVDDRLLTMNSTAAEILGVDPDAFFSKPLRELSPGLAEVLHERPIEEEARRGEVRHVTRDAHELILGVSISPLFNHRSQPVGRIVNFQDLTEVRKLERDVQRAERLTVIGTLAAGIAHEIRNPLASISGSVELLAQDPNTDEDSAALMGIVTREIERLNGLITELLDYANPRPPKLARFDLCAVLRDTLRVFEQTAKFQAVEVSLRNDDPTRRLEITADPEKIRQLVWNLLRNGAEAALDGGKSVWLSAEASGDEIVMRFEDNGPGIDETVIHSVFDPFFTTKAKGSGLGLATVHSTVVDHKGTISVTSAARDSTADPGSSEPRTCFEVRLPYDGNHAA